MSKRRPKPEPIPTPRDEAAPVATESRSDAETHAAADATDPAAFEFPFGAAAGTPAAETRREAEPATDAPTARAPSFREGADADWRSTDAVFPASALPPKPPAGDAERRPDAAGEGKAWNPLFGLRGDYEAEVRLLEDRRFKQMHIRFETKPSDAVREAMRDGGFRWRQAEQAWTRRIDPEHAWRTRAEAETLFGRVVALIREERGLEPARDAGPQAG